MTSSPPRTAPPLDIGRISLRVKADGSTERGFLAGGTEAGKSTLAELLAMDFMHRYYNRGARRLIVDSKPRYRAQWQTNGLSAAHRYRKWGHGKAVPGSCVVDTPAELKTCWKLGYRTAIVQGESRRDVGRLVDTMSAFLDSSSARRPQLLQIDETSDFFHSNGAAKGGDDVVERSARAGRERGTAGLYCTQRTFGLSSALMENLTRLYAMRLDSKKDAKRFQEMGAPEFVMPTDEHVFMYWSKHDYRNVYGPYRLELPAGYR